MYIHFTHMYMYIIHMHACMHDVNRMYMGAYTNAYACTCVYVHIAQRGHHMLTHHGE